MEEEIKEKNNKKRKIVVLVVALLLVLVAGATFAWWTWTSANNTKVNFTVASTFSCSADGGGNITSNDVTLVPSSCTNSDYAIKRKITASATLDTTDPVYMDLWLDINNIGTGLTNSQNFMYAITTSSTSCESPIKSGSFNGKVATNKVDLLKGIEFTETGTDTYYLWIWLDNAETNSNTMNQPFNLSLNGSCTTEAPPTPVSFADDSWELIKSAVASGDYPYQVGDTKCVALNGFTTINNNGCSNGEFLVRVANTSTPSECSGADFSLSACGFVVEFVDIITTHAMNSSGTYKDVTYNNGWNVDGWPVSEMKSYLDTTIFNALPNDLKTSITTTKTVSGHGSTTGETNFTSNDKLYLLAPHEVWEDVDGNTSSGIDYYDTAYNNTRQLDYYSSLGVTTSNYSGTIKKLNGDDWYWWLRGARSTLTSYFLNVNSTGTCISSTAKFTSGVAPAFRVG